MNGKRTNVYFSKPPEAKYPRLFISFALNRNNPRCISIFVLQNSIAIHWCFFTILWFSVNTGCVFNTKVNQSTCSSVYTWCECTLVSNSMKRMVFPWVCRCSRKLITIFMCRDICIPYKSGRFLLSDGGEVRIICPLGVVIFSQCSWIQISTTSILLQHICRLLQLVNIFGFKINHYLYPTV